MKKIIILGGISAISVITPLLVISCSFESGESDFLEFLPISLVANQSGKTDKKLYKLNLFNAKGENGEGYIKFDNKKLKDIGISNLNYKIFNKTKEEVKNYEISNGDIIKYSFNYDNNEYSNKAFVSGLFGSTDKIFQKYKDDILKTIHNKVNHKLSSDNDLKILQKNNQLKNWIMSFENSTDELFSIIEVKPTTDMKFNKHDLTFQIILLNDMPNYNLKKGNYFFVTVLHFKNVVQQSDIKISDKNFKTGWAAPYYWNYNDDGTLKGKFNIPINILVEQSLKWKEF